MIVLFDGECSFCNKSVQFILKRDPNAIFKFTSLQGEAGQKLLAEHHITKDIDSFILIDGEKCYSKSSAALRVAANLKGFWKATGVFLLVPKFIRDSIYHIVAKYRHRLQSQSDSCKIPTEEERKRFL